MDAVVALWWSHSRKACSSQSFFLHSGVTKEEFVLHEVFLHYERCGGFMVVTTDKFVIQRDPCTLLRVKWPRIGTQLRFFSAGCTWSYHCIRKDWRTPSSLAHRTIQHNLTEQDHTMACQLPLRQKGPRSIHGQDLTHTHHTERGPTRLSPITHSSTYAWKTCKIHQQQWHSVVRRRRHNHIYSYQARNPSQTSTTIPRHPLPIADT